MRYIRLFLTILLVFILSISVEVNVSAINTGFSVESMLDDEIDVFLKNVNISVLVDEPPKKAIDCFDVNENGLIAIGCSDFENKTVGIYTSGGDFQYGYSFECAGNFGIEFDKSTLNIYFVRSDVAISVNSLGEVESVLKICNTYENNAYWNNYVFSNRRIIGDTEYILKNDMGILNIFASSYSQLVITNRDSEKSIIYDVSSAQFSNMLVMLIGVLAFICLVVAVVIRQFIKLRRGD